MPLGELLQLTALTLGLVICGTLLAAVLVGCFAIVVVLALAAGMGLWVLHAIGRAVTKLLEAAAAVAVVFALPLTARRGRAAVKLGYHHLSSHAGDEFLERNPRFVRVNYVRDELLAGVTYQPTPDWVTYTEVGYAFYVSGGAEPWEVQLGTEYSPASAGCPACGRPFLAVHGHLREEVDFGVRQVLHDGAFESLRRRQLGPQDPAVMGSGFHQDGQLHQVGGQACPRIPLAVVRMNEHRTRRAKRVVAEVWSVGQEQPVLSANLKGTEARTTRPQSRGQLLEYGVPVTR